jgi:hypothetical protein
MPSIIKLLNLDSVHLVCYTDKLKLSVTSVANLILPSHFSYLDEKSLVEAVISGKLWISRGMGCRIDIELFYNGERLENRKPLSSLGILGTKICDMEV